MGLKNALEKALIAHGAEDVDPRWFRDENKRTMATFLASWYEHYGPRLTMEETVVLACVCVQAGRYMAQAERRPEEMIH
jgi:hypothetical protein